MIIKSYEINQKDIKNNKFFLLYGKNQGLIDETINSNLKPKLSKNIYFYEEIEVIKDKSSFRETMSNQSFFEDDKLIIISRVTDKILDIIEEIVDLNINGVSIILTSNILEKKSKLRTFFEKNNNTICIAFYEDNNLTLARIALDFFARKNINISQHNINLIVERCSGDRINLLNELQKIESFCLKNKKISTEDLLKITNLAENYDLSYLVNNSLAKNKKKTLNILNENNFSTDDCIIIVRIFLNKLKRLLKLTSEVPQSDNIDTLISKFRPPIFWKEKEIIKSQIKALNRTKIQNLLLQTNKLELLIKKNPTISINLVTNFILEQCCEN